MLRGQNRAGRRTGRDQLATLVGDFAFDETNSQSALNHFGARGQQAFSNRTNEADFHLDRREVFAVQQRSPKRDAHRRVGERRNQTAMDASHRVVVLRPTLDVDNCLTEDFIIRGGLVDWTNLETDQARNGSV